jgi:hypothetical protein
LRIWHCCLLFLLLLLLAASPLTTLVDSFALVVHALCVYLPPMYAPQQHAIGSDRLARTLRQSLRRSLRRSHSQRLAGWSHHKIDIFMLSFTVTTLAHGPRDVRSRCCSCRLLVVSACRSLRVLGTMMLRFDHCCLWVLWSLFDQSIHLRSIDALRLSTVPLKPKLHACLVSAPV